MLVARAYRLQREQIVGPDWTGSDRWDIAASLQPETNEGKQFV